MIRHTPGPWSIEHHENKEYGDLDLCSFAICEKPMMAGLDGLRIATVISDCIENHAANARLIAAAPDLLAALEEFVNNCYGVNDDYSDLRSAERMARAAIARARGEE